MRIHLTICAALALASCGPMPVNSTGVGAIAENITIEGTRGLVLAELAYSTAAQGALAAVNAGFLKGEQAERARRLNATITSALQRAKSAQSAAVQAAAVTEALDAIADLNAMLPEKRS